MERDHEYYDNLIKSLTESLGKYKNEIKELSDKDKESTDNRNNRNGDSEIEKDLMEIINKERKNVETERKTTESPKGGAFKVPKNANLKPIKIRISEHSRSPIICSIMKSRSMNNTTGSRLYKTQQITSQLNPNNYFGFQQSKGTETYKENIHLDELETIPNKQASLSEDLVNLINKSKREIIEQQAKIRELLELNFELKVELQHEKCKYQELEKELGVRKDKLEEAIREEKKELEIELKKWKKKSKEQDLDIESLKYIIKKRTEEANRIISNLKNDCSRLEDKYLKSHEELMGRVSMIDEVRKGERIIGIYGDSIDKNNSTIPIYREKEYSPYSVQRKSPSERELTSQQIYNNDEQISKAFSPQNINTQANINLTNISQNGILTDLITNSFINMDLAESTQVLKENKLPFTERRHTTKLTNTWTGSQRMLGKYQKGTQIRGENSQRIGAPNSSCYNHGISCNSPRVKGFRTERLPSVPSLDLLDKKQDMEKVYNDIQNLKAHYTQLDVDFKIQNDRLSQVMAHNQLLQTHIIQ